MTSGVLVLSWCLILAGLAVMARRYSRQDRTPSKEILVGAMMHRQGVAMTRITDIGLEGDLVQAARACLACAHRPECEKRLNRAEVPAYSDICPNARFLDGVSA